MREKFSDEASERDEGGLGEEARSRRQGGRAWPGPGGEGEGREGQEGVAGGRKRRQGENGKGFLFSLSVLLCALASDEQDWGKNIRGKSISSRELPTGSALIPFFVSHFFFSSGTNKKLIPVETRDEVLETHDLSGSFAGVHGDEVVQVVLQRPRVCRGGGRGRLGLDGRVIGGLLQPGPVHLEHVSAVRRELGNEVGGGDHAKEPVVIDLVRVGHILCLR